MYMSVNYKAAAALLTVIFVSCTGSPDRSEEKEPEVVKVVEYHDNGMVSKQGTTVDGKRTGRWESFYPNGLRWSETTFKDGVKEGPTVTYFPNGLMRYDGFYHDDVRSGKWTFYDTTGAVVMKLDMETDRQGVDSLYREMLKKY